MHTEQPTIAIVIVTYNRAALLKKLLDSIVMSSRLPSTLVIVNNASTDDTKGVIEHFSSIHTEFDIKVLTLPENIGGSGGFHHGLKYAYELGLEWFWLMDDDVEVLPNGLRDLVPWMDQFKCFHGRRLDVDGYPFFWQPRFSEFLGIPLPYLRDPFAKRDFFLTNSGCFEGMMLHRCIVNQIGLPDARFFITWDDAVYGWLASKVTDVGYVNEFCLKRSRQQNQINLGFRKLTAGSDLFRYHVIRNRKYVKQYLKDNGRYNSLGFAIGSYINFAKEIFRLIFVGGKLQSISVLIRGWKDYRGKSNE